MLSLWRLARALAARIVALPREAAVSLGAEGIGQPARPDRLLRAILVVTPIGVLGWYALSQISWVITPSIEAWAVRPDPGPIAKGDYVMFQLSHALAGPEPVSVTKHALCLPGQRLDMIEKPSRTRKREWDAWYFCDQVLLNVSKPFTRGGAHLPHLIWGGPIPPGLMFVGSGAPNGFDSRYFGLVPVSALTRMKRIL
ncbi:MAG: type secretory pathway protease TraF-like protein [Bradyrhizobium sp.]|nr:type secretory pathway protease TraF-like protein [Bradyrhizobium sp.]